MRLPWVSVGQGVRRYQVGPVLERRTENGQLMRRWDLWLWWNRWPPRIELRREGGRRHPLLSMGLRDYLTSFLWPVEVER